MNRSDYAMRGLQNEADAELTVCDGFRVLVAEDHPTNQTFFAAALNGVGISFEMVDDGAMALARAGTRRFDMLLFDFRMPVLSGLEVLRLIRSTNWPNALTPALAATSDYSEATCRNLVTGGFDAVIAKPFLPTQLVEGMRKAIAGLGKHPGLLE